jgi:hypothetical protein
MQNKLKTTLALLFAGIINLQAAHDPSPVEVAWGTLLASKPADANRQAAALADPGALAIRDMVLASQVVEPWDIDILIKIVKATTEGDAAAKSEAVGAAIRAIAASAKTGAGVPAAQAMVKVWDRDLSGWSDEMIFVRPDLAAKLGLRADASPEFKARVWLVLKERRAMPSKEFFKTYRSTLPKSEQVAVTQRQKDLILAIPQRDASANAWLAEISADLVALQLDQ